MQAQRMWLSGVISGCVAGLLAGLCLAVFGICVAMTGKDPFFVSVQGKAGQARAVEIDGTVYRLVDVGRYAELSRYEWMVRHGR